MIDKGRAYFHSAPRADCVTGVFVIPGDFITVYKPSGEWLNVMYVARDGKETSGWLLEKRVRLRQAYGGGRAGAAIRGRTLAEAVTAPVRAVATAVARCARSALRGVCSRQTSGAAQAVAAVALGFVERLVDPSQQVVAAFAGPQVGATEADRQPAVRRRAGSPVPPPPGAGVRRPCRQPAVACWTAGRGIPRRRSGTPCRHCAGGP